MYKNGAEFWRDLTVSYGKMTAVAIAADYLTMQAGTTRDSENEFCRELQAAMNCSGCHWF